MRLRIFAPTVEVSAHCDLPCGVYDPAQARIEAQSVKATIEKALASDDPEFKIRATIIKEQRSHLVKEHLWVLWTDYFKAPHFEKYPDLHTLFNEATKLAGAAGTKGDWDVAKADALFADAARNRAPGADVAEHAIDAYWRLLHTPPLSAMRELRAAARTDAAVRERLAPFIAAFDRAEPESVMALFQPGSTPRGQAGRDLARFLLEGLRKVKDKEKVAYTYVVPDSVVKHLDLYAE